MPNSAPNKPFLRLDDALAAAMKKLKAAGIEGAEADARILAAYVLKLDRAQLLSQKDRVLTPLESRQFDSFIECRARHEPVARIVGEREFWSLPFGLNAATLDPRPDSETVVGAVLKLVRSSSSPLAGEDRWGGGRLGNPIDGQKTGKAKSGVTPPPLTPPARGGESGLRILDLGTGTGCLLLALLHELPNATGLGVDKVPLAVEQAQENARKLGLDARATFKTGDWLEGIAERFDIIVSNPPYIAHKDIAELMPEVRDYDPPLALDGGTDGFAAYRLLIPHLPEFLKPGGIVAFEIGLGQAESVRKTFADAGLADIFVHEDLGGIERCVTALRSDQ